ncbi:MAG: 1-deoxy-D-xylulose-5-phosphate reductoisomerase [Clostridiales bacterium]|nr:1-deoxy-D-xylulose-5-phosphate reductoisomerase [Clostridiales bacterium]
MKTIAILGSTGSIGTQTLDVIRQHREDFRVSALSAGNNIDLLEKQIREFRPALVSVATEKKARELRVKTADLNIAITYGMEGLLAVAAQAESDLLVTAVVGMMGIRPTMAAIKAGKDIALANKETLVTAGHLIMPMAEEYGVKILPVDSEHSAIFQSWHGERAHGNAIDKILLTASGGPFRGKKREDLEHVTLEDALHHPNWSMGRKITVDSATMVNKGLEVMEAKWLFGVDLDQIQVVVHPQSVIHSMVQYVDGAVIAQLGTPDMRLPIQYALYYPKRKYLNEERLDFYSLSTLTFEKPDMKTFSGLRLALEAMRRGGNMPTVFNAANEKAVALFLNRKIRFLEIAELIGESMEVVPYVENPNLEDILATEQEVYTWIERIIGTDTANDINIL